MRAPKTTGQLSAGLGLAVRGLFPYAWVVVRRELDSLYILQLERYSPGRFARWLGRHWRKLVPDWEAATQVGVAAAACLLVLGGIHWLATYALWLGAGHLARSRQRSLQVSQRLQFTSRAVRLSAAAFGLSGILVAGAAVTAALAFPIPGLAPRLVAGGVVGFALAGTLAPLLVWLAGTLLLPVERRIFHGYLVEADRRMRRYPGRVVGITGSYGKTTTKLILAQLLAARYRTCKTPDGVNTTMGITRIIREELRDDHEVFVVEMAAYGPGEIREVCDLVHPTLGILTAVGVQHLERFGTEERIADAKYELVAALPPGAPAVINADDPICLGLARRARAEGKRVLLYGMEPHNEPLAIRGLDLAVSPGGTSFRILAESGEVEAFATRLVGRWNISNILGAVAAAREWGVPLPALREAVAALAPAPRRLEVREEGGIVKILDVANANPRGAAMALEVLGQFSTGSRILITPGMVELGPVEAEENRRFGERAAAVCDYVVLVGPEQTRPIRDGLQGRGFPAERVLVARDADEVADLLAGVVRPGDVLLYENRLPDTYLEVGS